MPAPSEGKQDVVLVADERYATVLGAAWSPSGRHIASAARFNSVDVWDAATGEPICIFREHLGKVQALAWSPDARYIASADWNSTVQVWESTRAERVYIYDGHYSGEWVWSVAWSPDGTRIASGGLQSVHIWTPRWEPGS